MGILGYCVSILVLCTIQLSSCTNVCTNKVGVQCDCAYSNTGQLTVDCSQKSLTSVPDGIQQDASVADFRINVITTVELNDFEGLNLLEKLYLQRNSISSIAIGAFQKLPKLKILHIQKNQLAAIESGHFRNLGNLKQLFLQENQISRIAAGAFDTLFKLETLSLQRNSMTAITSGHFHHLPSLISLDLSYNRITSIARDSILYLPMLSQLAINENPVNCDCETRAFRESINIRKGQSLLEVSVISPVCAGTSTKMTDATDTLFGNCQGNGLFRTLTCNNCKNARSTDDCMSRNSMINCTTQQFTNPVCQEEITYVATGLFMNKGCNNYLAVMQAERNNAAQCYGTSTIRCTFSCITQRCTNQGLRGRIHSSFYMVVVQLSGTLPSSLSDPSTPVYANFVNAVQSQIDNTLSYKANSFGSFIPELTYAGPPNFTLRVRIEYSTVSEIDSKTKAAYIQSRLSALLYIYTADYLVRNVEVNLMDVGCPNEVMNSDKGQFSWPFLKIGESYSISCPVPSTTGAKATRVCLSDSSGTPVWGVADTSACLKTSSVTQSLTDLANTQVNQRMIHAGIGPTHVNNFLAALNIPPIHAKTIKKRETEIGRKIHEVAVKSCKDAQEQEIALSNEKVEASFDAGWQKRGTGWNYDSNTGHASMIGSKTGKVLEFSHRSRICKVCDYYKGKKETVPSHECCINWQGSSKGMEPDMAVQMTHALKDQGCEINVLHADNDSTTTSRLKVDFEDLEKKDDQNHIKKGFSKKLYEMSKNYTELKQPDVIQYLVRCFMYAIKENNSSAENIQLAMDRLLLHIFGDHSMCEDVDWCNYKLDPDNFK